MHQTPPTHAPSLIQRREFAAFVTLSPGDVSSPLDPLRVATDASVYDNVSFYEDPCSPPRSSTDALEQGTSADAVQIGRCVCVLLPPTRRTSEGHGTSAHGACVSPLPTYWKDNKTKHARTRAKKRQLTISCIVFSFPSPHGGIRPLSPNTRTRKLVLLLKLVQLYEF